MQSALLVFFLRGIFSAFDFSKTECETTDLYPLEISQEGALQ